MASTQSLKIRLEQEIPVNFLYEHDSKDYPVFELDVVPLITHAVEGLRRLDTHRLSVNPNTAYLFAPHALEVAQDMEALARHLGAAESVATGLYYLGLVHDIGKLFLPPEIWETTPEKPSGAFKALRRTHGPLGAAYLSGDPDFLAPPYVSMDVLPFLRGEKPLAGIVPGNLAGRVPERMDFEGLLDAIKSSPFRNQKTGFLPLAVTAALRHHEITGTAAPPDQPVWLKLLAVLEDLSGNRVERPHFNIHGRGTSLIQALDHMREEGPETHDLMILDLISSVKTGESAPVRHYPHDPEIS
ncbi:MAG: hypothetical protein H6862_01005 [Rhodospirillales bacterium]|nr:hypothetical protein [Rhodospirillales bacterium]